MLFLCLLHFVSSCSLGRVSVGQCVEAGSVSSIDFCGEYLEGKICVPTVHNLWPDWDSSAKDLEVQRSFAEFLSDRIVDELDGSSVQSFTRSADCIEAYKLVLCLINFPSCRDEESFPLCKNVCDDYVDKCGLESSNCDGLATKSSQCSSAVTLGLVYILLW
mmetsp:Transcript_13298/g.24983  ORF Transcript_13298/g.24983 Transcript_13298/m.24983 type:complete len:162 (-) Transcript_13298:6-491(-)